MATNPFSRSSSPLQQLHTLPSNLSISSQSSTGASERRTSSPLPFADLTEASLYTFDGVQQLESNQLRSFEGAMTVSQIIERDKATIALYNQLINPTPLSVNEEYPHPVQGWSQSLAGTLPPLKAGSSQEQALQVREILKEHATTLAFGNTINLSGLGLTCVPPELELLNGELIIDLSNNRFTSFPENLPRGASLVNLSHNQISSEKPINISSHVHCVVLSHNNFSSFPSIAWPRNANLRLGPNVPTSGLDLSHNQIETLPANMSHLDHLRGLNLSYNRVNELPETITLPKNLRSLLLPFNKVSSLPENMDTSYGRAANLEDGPMGSTMYINLTENPVKNLQGVHLGGNLAVSVGAQWAIDATTYDSSFASSTLKPDLNTIIDPLKGPRVGRSTPGPYLYPLQLIEAAKRWPRLNPKPILN